MMSMGSLISSGRLKDLLSNWSIEKEFDTKLTQDILNIKFRDVKESLILATETLIDTGFIVDKRKK